MSSSHNDPTKLRLRLAQLERDNEAIRRERNDYRDQCASARHELAALSQKYEDVLCRLRDMERNSCVKLEALESETPPAIDVKVEVKPTTKVEARTPTKTLNTDPRKGDVWEIDDFSDIEEVPRDKISPNYSTSPPLNSTASSSINVTQVPATPSSSAGPVPSSKIETRGSSTGLSTVDPIACSKRHIGELEETEPSPQRKRLKGGLGDNLPNLSVGKPAAEVPSQKDQVGASTGSSSLSRPSSAIADMARPVLKIKVEEAIVLFETTVSRFLSGVVPFCIDPAPPILAVPRRFLVMNYRAPLVAFMHDSKKDGRHFLFPTLDINPQMPKFPGAPGLLLSSGFRQKLFKFTWTLFTQLPGRPIKWEYLGQYQCSRVGQLSSAEFSSQRQTVKNKWADKIKNKTLDEFQKIRARIWLRKTKGVYSEENVQTETEQLELKSGNGGQLTTGDILQALERGDEHIDIIRVVCIDYDHDFVQGMASGLPIWAPAPGKQNNPKAQKKLPRGKKTTAKRMSDSTSDSEDSVDDAKSTKRPARSTRARRQSTKALTEYTDEDASDSD